VSCEELDLMVEIARRQPGALGARMTGAGFGGCTVNLVMAEAADSFVRAVQQAYEAQTGVRPQVFRSTAGEGARIERC